MASLYISSLVKLVGNDEIHESVRLLLLFRSKYVKLVGNDEIHLSVSWVLDGRF